LHTFPSRKSPIRALSPTFVIRSTLPLGDV
jgi:hypothetical protein